MITYDKLATMLVSYCIDAQIGEYVRIDAGVAALPLVREVYARVLQTGALPVLHLSFSGQAEMFYEYAREQQLKAISAIDVAEAETIDKVIAIRSQENTVVRAFPEKESIRASSARSLSEKKREKRWVLTLYPTDAYAQESGMSLRQFEEFYIKALFLDKDDPSAEWKAVSRRQEEYIKLFTDKRHVVIRGDGTQLSFDIENRLFINSDGKQNMPSGEIYTSPVEDSVEGTFTSDIPNTKYGSEISGSKIVFSRGRVVEAASAKGQELLTSLLKRDEGASVIGEFGIGCNYGLERPIRNILFDEKIGGTVHIAVGQGYEKAGGSNKSGLHLDLIHDMRRGGEIVVDGEVIYKDGSFASGG